MIVRRALKIVLATVLLTCGLGLANSFALRLDSGIGGGGGSVAGAGGVFSSALPCVEGADGVGCPFVVQVGGGGAAVMGSSGADSTAGTGGYAGAESLTEFD